MFLCNSSITVTLCVGLQKMYTLKQIKIKELHIQNNKIESLFLLSGL